MRTRLSIALLAAVPIAVHAQTPRHAASVSPPPAAFIENRGQWDESVRFLVRARGLDLWITNTGMLYDVRGTAPAARTDVSSATASAVARATHDDATVGRIDLAPQRIAARFIGARAATIEGVEALSAYHNYYVGDSTRWAEHVPLYRGVLMSGVYRGVDVRLSLEEERPRYDVIVAPGVDPSIVRLRFDGAVAALSDDGALVLTTMSGEVRHQGLFAYQGVGASRRAIPCRFVVDRDGTVGFRVADYDRSEQLVIDPLVWSSYLGGSNDDLANGVAIDGAGAVWIAGQTISSDFPTLNAFQRRKSSSYDAFVTKVSSSGALLWSSYYGGSGDDRGYDVAVSGDGSATVVGMTSSTNFPTLNATQRRLSGNSDAFVMRLNGNGARVWATYLGGSATEEAGDVAVDGSGNSYVRGKTWSANFPVLAAAQPAFGGGVDMFVAKLGPTGAIAYATYLGGSVNEDGDGDIVVDATGSAYIASSSSSMNYPTINAWQSTNAGAYFDAVLTRLNPNGTFGFSTYLGGVDQDQGRGVALLSNGDVAMVGQTLSPNFPVASAFKGSLSGAGDAFVAEFTSAGALVMSSYLGGSSSDLAIECTVDAAGTLVVTGATSSSDFPTANPVQSAIASTDTLDAYVWTLDVMGATPFSTYLGGAGKEYGLDVAIGPDGAIVVLGETHSSDFPTLGAFQSTFGGGPAPVGDRDCFVTKLTPGQDVQPLRASGPPADAPRHE
jgi:hypothetical protein